MSRQKTAAVLLSPGQKVLALILAALALTQALVFGPMALLRTIVALVTAFYVVFVGFKLVVWWAATRTGNDTYADLTLLADRFLPRYTVFVPMVKETKETVRNLTQALLNMNYPAAKLEILLLVEEYDDATQAHVTELNLPQQFKMLVVPDVGPRTKPKACNYGYMNATGDLAVIYDAEDRPQRNQLRFAATVFKYLMANAGKQAVGCLQARLVFWNPRVSGVASFYWAEYVTHFFKVLEGLAKLGLIPPLGGTSNHFRMEVLEEVSAANGDWTFEAADGSEVVMRGPWDPYNLTEDADLAYRLYDAGYTVELIPTITYEEAPKGPKKSKNQRSRWLQGYGQTGLVHTRKPLTAMRRVGPVRWFCFNLFMLGTPVSIIINPITWGTTALYVASRLADWPAVTTFIEGLFPGPVYYAGMLVAVLGNSLLFYQKLVTPLLRQEQSESIPGTAGQHHLEPYLHEQEYGLTLRLLFTPVWWAFTSASGYRALRKLLTPSQRFNWDKTAHGHAAIEEARLAQLTTTTTSSTTATLPTREGEAETR